MPSSIARIRLTFLRAFGRRGTIPFLGWGLRIRREPLRLVHPWQSSRQKLIDRTAVRLLRKAADRAILEANMAVKEIVLMEAIFIV